MKEYFVDFSSWKVYADSYEEAEKMVMDKIKSGCIPRISGLDSDDSQDRTEKGIEDYGETIQLEICGCNKLGGGTGTDADYMRKDVEDGGMSNNEIGG